MLISSGLYAGEERQDEPRLSVIFRRLDSDTQSKIKNPNRIAQNKESGILGLYDTLNGLYYVVHSHEKSIIIQEKEITDLIHEIRKLKSEIQELKKAVFPNSSGGAKE